MVPCSRWSSERTRRDGQTRLRDQRWRCIDCGRQFTARSTSAFAQHGFPDAGIALAVRWYMCSRLRYADVGEWFAKRGLVVERRTTYRSFQRFLARFQDAARTHWHTIGTTWRVDESDPRLTGTWTYIHRAIDHHG